MAKDVFDDISSTKDKKKRKMKLGDEIWGKSEPITKLFPSMMMSDVVTLQVRQNATEEVESWRVHSSFLEEESEKLRSELSKENTPYAGVTIQVAEDPKLFSYFIDYLYSRGKTAWTILPRNRDSQGQQTVFRSVSRDGFSGLDEEAACLMTLARLYIMGKRLNASRFQTTTLLSIKRFLKALNLEAYWMVRLLRMVATDLQTSLVEDPLWQSVLSYAVQHIRQLQSYNGFKKLLEEIPDLAVGICLLANPSSDNADKGGVAIGMKGIGAEVECYCREVAVLTEELQLMRSVTKAQ